MNLLRGEIIRLRAAGVLRWSVVVALVCGGGLTILIALAQLSGAMNEAALWISRQDDAHTARARSHAALDAPLAGDAP